MISIHNSNNLAFLSSLEKQGTKVDLVYIDPPFNTGKTMKGASGEYCDKFPHEEYLSALTARLSAAKQVMAADASIFVHLDYRYVHDVKVACCDPVFGRNNFMNELIWAYDYGARSKSKWPAKHDTILWYVMDNHNYTFNYDAMDRLPYMAPGLVGPEKAARGKTPTDVWWQTIVPTNGSERTGYPTQKPIALLERIVKVHSNEHDLCLDFYAGSGSFGEACCRHNRDCILVDNNPEAIAVMEKRFGCTTV